MEEQVAHEISTHHFWGNKQHRRFQSIASIVAAFLETTASDLSFRPASYQLHTSCVFCSHQTSWCNDLIVLGVSSSIEHRL